jgi:cytochrome c553
MNTLKTTITIFLLAGCSLTMSVWAADKAAGEKKAENCAGCHGSGGKSSNAQFPNLAAQQATYIIAQLKAFKSGERKNSMMEALAANLSDADMENLAAYFSALPAVTAGGGDATLAKTGQEKSKVCLSCHGKTATGNGEIPRLAGQHPDYLVKQLSSFKNSSRINGSMQALAGTLAEEDMKALAAYLGSL